MLPNEEFALACRAYYEEQGLIVDATNGQFAHCPLPKGMGEKGYYLLWEHHQQQGLLQSRDVGRRCFFSGDVKKWLLTADYFPTNFFELWDIYDEFLTSSVSQLNTPDAIERRIETRKKTGSWYAPQFQTDGARRKAVETRKRNGGYSSDVIRSLQTVLKAQQAIKKRVEITFPGGRVGVYPSVVFASIAVGRGESVIRSWVKKGKPNKQGANKGYSARYV